MKPKAETNAAPCPRPVSVEITPAEFDYYMKRAQEMRAETVARIIDRCFAALRRVWARPKSATGGRAPARLATTPAPSRSA